MPARDPRIDVYIEKSAAFAKPILRHLRKLVHAGCPEVEETIKWGMPHFVHRGMLCAMASFKHHCTFGFWKGRLIFGNRQGDGKKEAMGQFGRLQSVDDLPADMIITRHVRKAVRLNEAGVKIPRVKRPRKRLVIPKVLLEALQRNPKARETFENFTYSHKKEYAEWIGEAKTGETRAKRLNRAIDWMSRGKPRHWKYAQCGA